MRYVELTADCGEMIGKYAERMIGRFNHLKEVNQNVEFQVKGDFNGVTLYVDENATVDSIVNDYHVGLEKNAEEYRKTDEYKIREKHREDETKRLQLEADAKIEEFKTLDKTNKVELLQWLSDFQEYSDRIDVHTDNRLILSELNALGYTSGMNCGVEFNGKDMDNFAGYIIGQCISCLERVGAIHQVVIKFVDDWKKEFVA
jgi:hypothetical protein